VHVDAELACGVEGIVPLTVTGTGVDIERRLHGVGRPGLEVGPIGSLILRRSWRSSLKMTDGTLHRIEDELGERWLEEWADEGVTAIETYLAKHQAFQSFLLENDASA
jgi:hypothetical protein